MKDSILRIRAGQENERSPIYMEPAVAAIHSLSGDDSSVHLEIGLIDDKLGFFMRSPSEAVGLCESQLYAQYPDIDIEHLKEDPFIISEEEEVLSMDLTLSDPEVFPIKRHPQFDDMLSRVNVDSIAGITSTLVRYDQPGMRGHVQVVIKPLKTGYRRRALRFLPLLKKGFASVSARYANFFTKVQLSRGWKRILLMPIAVLFGGFRAWPGFNRFFIGTVSFSTGEVTYSSEREDDLERASARSHDREDSVGGAVVNPSGIEENTFGLLRLNALL